MKMTLFKKKRLMNNKKNWEASYSRGENFIYYPKEEIVKFLNRFIKKKFHLINIISF